MASATTTGPETRRTWLGGEGGEGVGRGARASAVGPRRRADPWPGMARAPWIGGGRGKRARRPSRAGIGAAAPPRHPARPPAHPNSRSATGPSPGRPMVRRRRGGRAGEGGRAARRVQSARRREVPSASVRGRRPLPVPWAPLRGPGSRREHPLLQAPPFPGRRPCTARPASPPLARPPARPAPRRREAALGAADAVAAAGAARAGRARERGGRRASAPAAAAAAERKQGLDAV